MRGLSLVFTLTLTAKEARPEHLPALLGPAPTRRVS